ncbi:hypothetical protein BC833DRAFT_564515 [Globomyces pollinis-pini]|nr:hypothetical protein BC833DRAFT_564515 [Globomyces pollinis-pini]
MVAKRKELDQLFDLEKDVDKPIINENIVSNNSPIIPLNTSNVDNIPNTSNDPHNNFANKELVDPALIKEQLKWITTVIRNMKKKKEAIIFLTPVDPVKLNIPTYFTVITHPMDISTIEKKLSSGVYKNAQEAIADAHLMLNNCLVFNGEDSVVWASGKVLLKWLEKEQEKIPKTLKKPDYKKKRVSDIGLGIRESISDRPKRDIPTTSTDRIRTRTKESSLELKFASHILVEVMKQKCEAFNWPFLSPVDPDLLGIPHYRTIIKHPMDLSTIKKKLDSGEYDSLVDFEDDFRLMLSNCYLFNPPETAVYQCAQQLEKWFDSKLLDKNSFLSQYGDVSKSRTKSTHDYSSEGSDDSDLEQIKALKDQITVLHGQIQVLMEKRSRKRKRKLSTSNASNGIGGSVPAFVGKPKSKPKSSEKRSKKKRSYPQSSDDEKMPETDVTYEQKRELSDNINILPPDLLPQVFEIIKESSGLNAVADEEIELDIDSLPKHVLWKLYLFVKKHTRPPKKAKYEDEQNVAPGQDDFEMEQSPLPKKSIKPAKSSTTKTEPTKKPGRPSKTSNSTTRKRGSTPPIPIRTEKGDCTSYGERPALPVVLPPGTILDIPSTSTTIESTVTTQVKKTIPPIQRKDDSLLDSAWSLLEELKKPEIETVPIEESIVEPREGLSAFDTANTTYEPFAHNNPSPIIPTLTIGELQHYNTILEEFETEHDLNDREEIDGIQKRVFEMDVLRDDFVPLEDWLLNTERDLSSDEDGAVEDESD